jgi:hypothetical protein
MATKKSEQEENEPVAAEAAVEAVKEADPPEDAEAFDHEFLIEAAPSYGFKPHEAAGALSAISKKNLTIEEAKAAVGKWLKAPVSTDTEA